MPRGRQRPALSLDCTEAQRCVACDGGEVLLGAQQFDAGRDASLRNDAVDGAPQGDASAPKSPMEPRSGNMSVRVEREDRKA